MQTKKTFIRWVWLSSFLIIGMPAAGFSSSTQPLPPILQEFISEIKTDNIGISHAAIHYEELAPGLIRADLKFTLKDTVRQDDWQLQLLPAFKPDFHWAPHLTPTAGHIIPQHVFRAPALIVSDAEKQLVIIPDVELLKKNRGPGWYMDLDAYTNKLVLGMSRSAVKEHVLFTRREGGVYPPGKLEFGFYIMTSTQQDDLFNPWRKVLSFFWQKWGSDLYASGEPLNRNGLLPYVQHTYNWAFNSWKKSVWQEFELNGKKVGAPVFIVNVTQSPNYPGEINEHEFRSIWNQAWFNSLRSAQGLYRYARRNKDEKQLSYALMTKELALAFPQKNGFFPAVIAAEMEQFEKNGKQYQRSKGWDSYYFGNSNRNPSSWDPRQSPLHILDMSYTAWLMLTWYDELEKDKRLLDYAASYAEGLLQIQDDKGFFPAWLSPDSQEPMEALKQSPETSMSVTFLLKLFDITKDIRFRDAALKAMQAVMTAVVREGRWEDFETYWSCSRYGSEDLVGKKVSRNNMYKQNTLSMYWTAEALLNCYQLTGDKNYLDFGWRTLDEMLMTQASWQPPYIHVRALGGFGVMNADAEWNDSRQSLFAELIVRYGHELKFKEYIQRGLAALRASFVMMYCPESPTTKKQWELAWNFFGKEDYGFMMENYGHGGETNPEGLGMGEFTIYDWGNGAAAETYNRMLDHYGKKFLEEN